MSEVLVRCENVSKKFCRDLKYSLYYGLRGLAAEMLGRDQYHRGLRKHEFWAVKDVSFELRRGECLGLIGQNGAGKSTLLKMLNGLIRPDQGRITVRGDTAAMIALGAGFNPILTGRENIYISCSLRGLTKKETDRKLEAIIDFAELAEFIDMPMQSYSSGMSVRLGFSAAIHMQPDVLIIDEVLAVGDMGFKEKAYNEIYRVIKSAAVIFVSHSIPQVTKICTRGMLMRRGKIQVASEQLEQVIDGYFAEFPAGSKVQVTGSGKVVLRALAARDPAGKELARSTFDNAGEDSQRGLAVVSHGQRLLLELELEVSPEVGGFAVIISFYDLEMKMVAQCVSLNQNIVFQDPGAARFDIRLDLYRLPLNRGRYKIDCILVGMREDNTTISERLLRVQNALELQVGGDSPRMGAAPVQLEAEWELLPMDHRVPAREP
jgi:lipopolysaccharide transport system ATP-binding protein